MPGNFTIVTVNGNNLRDHLQAVCFINPKHPSRSLKAEWLNKRFREGMVIKLLYLEGEKLPAA
jgi:hypothetical protein